MQYCFRIIFMLIIAIQWLNASFLENESVKAYKEKKLILLTVKSDFCPYCIKMKKDIFDVSYYSEKINQHYIHVEIERNDPLLPSALHVKYVPTNFILRPKTLHIIDEFAGYIKPEHFLELLTEVYDQEVK